MYNKSYINITASILISMLVLSSNVVAKDCYEKSPNLIKLKDKYYDIEETKNLSGDEKSKLNFLFDKIEGKWEGESSYSECKGPDRAPSKEYKTFTVASTIKLNSNNDLMISANKSYSNNITRHEVITLLGKVRIFELAFLNNTSVLFSERALRKNINGGVHNVETIYEITFNNNSLIFVRSYYSNGVFVAEEKWSMN